MSDLTIGKTRRGLAVYAPTHPSYTHLEATHTVGADAHYLGQLARQAQPSYRAVDHEEAAALHYVRRNFHAARAHDAASQAMSKALALGEARDTPQGIVPAYASDLAWVYQGADPQLTLPDAAAAIQAVTLGWTAQDHLDNAVAQHCLAQAHGDDPSPKAAKRQALCAAAAYMHFAAAGVNPTTGPVGQSLNKARPHKYVSRERKGDTWVYTYPDDLKAGGSAHKVAETSEAPPATKKRQTKEERSKEMMAGLHAEAVRAKAARDAHKAPAHVEPGTPRGDAAVSVAAEDGLGIVNRDTLIAARPRTYDRHLESKHPLTAVAAHFVMHNFPESVPILRSDTPTEIKERRKLYVAAFDAVSKALDKLPDDASMQATANAVSRAVKRIIEPHRAFLSHKDFHDPLAQELYTFVSRRVFGSGQKTMGTAINKLIDAAQHVSKNEQEHTDKVRELARQHVAGVAPPGAVANIHAVVRKGAEVHAAATPAGQEHMLIKSMKMRSVNFTRSVKGPEREHHQKNLALSFYDLAEATGLPEEMCSFNGRLAINIAASKKGSTKAFYMPVERCITLSSDSGVGSLAHEWGHFFDNILSEVTGGKSGSFVTDRVHNDTGDGHVSQDNPHQGVHKAVQAVMQHPAMQAFVDRMEDNDDFRKKSRAKQKYWGSAVELWARCFERHIAYKLAKKGQENTYLVNNDFSYLWPNEDEVAKMAPAFDAVFAEAKKGGHINKALAALAFGQLGKRWYKAAPSELADVIRKAIHPRALTPHTPRQPTQIGTTRSGKPIFDIYHHPAHKGFDAKDWADAGKAVGAIMAHRKAVGAAKRVPVTKSVMAKAGTGEGSRGGHVIGHTALGNPIYSHGNHTIHIDTGRRARAGGADNQYHINPNRHFGDNGPTTEDDKDLTLCGTKFKNIEGYQPGGTDAPGGGYFTCVKCKAKHAKMMAAHEAKAQAKKEDTNKSLGNQAATEAHTCLLYS